MRQGEVRVRRGCGGGERRGGGAAGGGRGGGDGGGAEYLCHDIMNFE